MATNDFDREPKTPDPFIKIQELVKDSLSISLDNQYFSILNENLERCCKLIEHQLFWSDFTKNLYGWKLEYKEKYNGSLLADAVAPTFVFKSTDSIKNKIQRKIQGIDKFKNNLEELDGIFLPEQRIIPNFSDLIRTRIRTKYIDGVEFLGAKLEELARKNGIVHSREKKGEKNGYFAQHFNFTEKVTFRYAGQPIDISMTIEVQIASELATRMWESSHMLYEVDRINRNAPEPDQWQWSPSNPRYISNQLGHMMHLADGLLVQLRDIASKQRQS